MPEPLSFSGLEDGRYGFLGDFSLFVRPDHQDLHRRTVLPDFREISPELSNTSYLTDELPELMTRSFMTRTPSPGVVFFGHISEINDFHAMVRSGMACGRPFGQKSDFV